MKAVILAAGYGNRMRPLTDNKHKTLLPIAGGTIIGRIMDTLSENGIKDIVVVTGYRDKELRNYLSEQYPGLDVTYVHNERYRETNNIFSMALALNAVKIDSDIILIESDLIYEPSVIKRIIHSRYETAALVDTFQHGMDGTVVTVENGIITNVIPPHLQDEKFDFSDKYKTLNIYKFSREFCNSVFKKLLTYYARTIDDNCYYELILGILIYMQREVVHAEILSGEEWAEVDDPNDLRIAEFKFNTKQRLKILEEGFGGYWNYPVTDFHFIRNMHFPNAAVISELRDSLPDLIHNYGSQQEILDQKLAWFLLCNKERVHVLNGCSQIYPFLRTRMQGERVLIPQPSFGEYPRIFPEADTYSDTVGIDTEGIEKRAADYGIIVFVNPNNPTGSFIKSEWIHEFAERNKEKIILVDESFIEFSECSSLMELCERDPIENIIVVKSLSKSLGIPGVRLGYVYSSNTEFNNAVKESIPIWNLNSLAECFLEVILKHRKSLQESFVETIRDRNHFSQELSKTPVVRQVYSSAANFLLVSLKNNGPSSGEVADTLLKKHKIYIRDISPKFSDGNSYIRLAVRLPEENSRLVECLKEFEV